MENIKFATSAVITVGAGRGFIVGDHVITAAHCLPVFPPCHSASDTKERTYEKLLAPLGAEPRVWAECMFADPIGDIAVLGTPDDQALPDESKAYDGLVEAESVTPLTVAAPDSEGWLLSLDGLWFRCTIEHQKCGPLYFGELAGKIANGMSGSPMISTTGAAVGVVCVTWSRRRSLGRPRAGGTSTR